MGTTRHEFFEEVHTNPKEIFRPPRYISFFILNKDSMFYWKRPQSNSHAIDLTVVRTSTERNAPYQTALLNYVLSKGSSLSAELKTKLSTKAVLLVFAV